MKIKWKKEKEGRKRKRGDEMDGMGWNGNGIGIEIGNGNISHQQEGEMEIPSEMKRIMVIIRCAIIRCLSTLPIGSGLTSARSLATLSTSERTYALYICTF